VADQEKWVEATDPDNHWCDSHNVEDFSDADADRITHFGALGTLNLHSRGWRITGTNLDNCKMICALANCKEFSLNKHNDQCFIAKETCSGTSRKSDTKYVESPDVEAACPRNGGGCADVDAVKYGGPDGEKLNCCEICRMKKICSDSPECKSSFSARRLSDADLMQISARRLLFATLPTKPVDPEPLKCCAAENCCHEEEWRCKTLEEDPLCFATPPYVVEDYWCPMPVFKDCNCAECDVRR